VFIRETILSVQNQTYPDWELIIVDDGSTDNSLSILQELSANESRIKLFKRDREPKGAPTCRNIGIENARGDYIIFLDSDDLMAPYCLQQRGKYISEFPDNDFWVFPMLIFMEHIWDTGRLTNHTTSENDVYRFLRSDIVWTISCPIWKKSALMRLNGFDESFPNCQDHDLHLRAIFEGLRYMKFLEEKPDTFYRKHDLDKIYEPMKPLKVLIGVNKLLKQTTSTYSGVIKNDQRMKKNIFLFLFDTSRKYTRNQAFQEPRELIDFVKRQAGITKWGYFRLKAYIFLSSIGLNRIRGYERLWNLLISRKAYPKTWGSKRYTTEE